MERSRRTPLKRTPQKRTPEKKTPQFNVVELRRLLSLYVKNRDRYHGRFQSGGKTGQNERRVLLTEWATEISSLGFANRTKKQIEEKLKNEVKKVQRSLRLEKEKYTGTGGGAGPHVPRLPSYLDPLVEALLEKNLKQGIPEIEEKSEDVAGVDGDGDEHSGVEVLLERKPTKTQLQRSLEQPDKHSSSPHPEVEGMSSRTSEQSKTSAATSREALSLFTNQRAKLWDEETKLVILKQKKAEAKTELLALQIEEARLNIELRKLEVEKARLELEKARGAPPVS